MRELTPEEQLQILADDQLFAEFAALPDCDLNCDGMVNALDVHLAVNVSLGTVPVYTVYDISGRRERSA